MQRESLTIVTLWRGDLSRPCHNEKEIEEATADGFVPYNPKDHEYPRFVYSGKLSQKVNSAAEERELAKEGWSRTPGADYGVDTPKPSVPTPAHVVSETGAMLSLIADLYVRIKALEAHAEGKRKPAKAADSSKSGEE